MSSSMWSCPVTPQSELQTVNLMFWENLSTDEIIRNWPHDQICWRVLYAIDQAQTFILLWKYRISLCKHSEDNGLRENFQTGIH